jgi:hypothetical protein
VEAWHAQDCAFVIRVTSAEIPKFRRSAASFDRALPNPGSGGKAWSRASVFLQLTVLEAIMKEALQPTLVLVLWIVFWLAGTLGGAVLQAWLIDIGVLSEIDPPWIITIGSSFVGFFAGAYAAVKLGDLALKQK